MNNAIFIAPVIVNRETVQQMLGGISRTTFWRKRQERADAGTPFPSKAPGTNVHVIWRVLKEQVKRHPWHSHRIFTPQHLKTRRLQ